MIPWQERVLQKTGLLVVKILFPLHSHLSVRPKCVLSYLNNDHATTLVISLTRIDGNQKPFQAQKAAAWHHDISTRVLAQLRVHFQRA